VTDTDSLKQPTSPFLNYIRVSSGFSGAEGKVQEVVFSVEGPCLKISANLYGVKLRNAMFVTNHDQMMTCRYRKVPAWIAKYKENMDDHASDPEGTELLCTCRQPWEGRFMIQCDYCREQFHGVCVNVSATNALEIDKYRCSVCIGD